MLYHFSSLSDDDDDDIDVGFVEFCFVCQLELSHSFSSPLSADEHIARIMVHASSSATPTSPVQSSTFSSSSSSSSSTSATSAPAPPVAPGPSSSRSAALSSTATATSQINCVQLARELRALVQGRLPAVHSRLLQDLFAIRPKVANFVLFHCFNPLILIKFYLMALSVGCGGGRCVINPPISIYFSVVVSQQAIFFITCIIVLPSFFGSIDVLCRSNCNFEFIIAVWAIGQPPFG